LNAELSYTFKPTPQGAVVPEMTIGLRGENLLNDEVRYRLGKDEVLQPGTNLRLFCIVRLN
jgi:iron complex outermembrane recepter protein